MVNHNIRSDTHPQYPFGNEKDACAIYVGIRKRGRKTFGTLKRSLVALGKMGHRTGYIKGEGDGAGVQTDIPLEIWEEIFIIENLNAKLVKQPNFWVGHLFVPRKCNFKSIEKNIHNIFQKNDLNIILTQRGKVDKDVLGKNARKNPPEFWQIAGNSLAQNIESKLLAAQVEIEESLYVHFASLSNSTVVYKVHGSIEVLARYFSDLQNRKFTTSIALCHARYSTNTVSTFEKAQPFSLLGHNGEINTIKKFQKEAEQLNITLPKIASDSQIIDRTLHSLCANLGLDLFEAMEVIFPPTQYKINRFPKIKKEIYKKIRQSFGLFAQGPVAIIARYKNTVVATVDELGLRPLWQVETEKEIVLSSERGVIPLDSMVASPRPLAPGEKFAIRTTPGENFEIFTHNKITRKITENADKWLSPIKKSSGNYLSEKISKTSLNTPKKIIRSSLTQLKLASTLVDTFTKISVKEINGQPNVDVPVVENSIQKNIKILSANGWKREHVADIATMSKKGKEAIGSLGFDGALAILRKNRKNLADYFKESVAVVTNPAIDRGREQEVFSLNTLLGARPEISGPISPDDKLIELSSPLLLSSALFTNLDIINELSSKFGTISIEKLSYLFENQVTKLILGILPNETIETALSRISKNAIEAVSNQSNCLILDDTQSIELGYGWLDPHLAISYLDQALKQHPSNPNLRRRTGIVISSASIRTLHDIVLLLGFGADAINPYAMLRLSIAGNRKNTLDSDEQYHRQLNLLESLHIGIEKVISTTGCHDLGGYSRSCSSIGLSPTIANIFQSPNYFGDEKMGVTWETLNIDSTERSLEIQDNNAKGKLNSTTRFFPKFWKTVEACSNGEINYETLNETYRKHFKSDPISLRHLLDIKTQNSVIDPKNISLSITGHDFPILISAMSFGSQGELAYRAFAQAGAALNIICINGEGGELPDMMGIYKKNRGQQVASARFGVNAELLNSADVIEIKIGQGAKPGEGGMLPGSKVVPQVAIARHTMPFVTLLSPSNNHDLYSIEDLAQLIEELKVVNPNARISVKCPVVPGIGVIAVGIAKAGADIISLSGYDGGTGAARKHALEHVGLPAEIGVIQSHRALIDSGLRNRVEIWCDGGMKSGEDAFKMILLGANRIGFGSMAMMSIGCTNCRLCHQGNCHVGITTHIKTKEEALNKGLKRFVPRDYPKSVKGIINVFEGIGQELRLLTAQVGAKNIQDLVGRADLLEQVRGLEQVNLSSMLKPAKPKTPEISEPGIGFIITRPRNHLTRMMSELIVDSISNNEDEVSYFDEVMANDRALGANLFGELVRHPEIKKKVKEVHVRLGPSSIAGNGFAAWITENMDFIIEGGAQDGAAKGASGGRVAIMKGLNHDGQRIDGNVGKSFAYGAQKGILIVQGNADSRACIRLSGADVVLGGEIITPINDKNTEDVGTNANLKGFACEYMTSGRVIILGDPGPFAFSGMTGGIVYQRLTPEMGFDQTVLTKRIANGADVIVGSIDDKDIIDIQYLYHQYQQALEDTNQFEMANRIEEDASIKAIQNRFIKIIPIISN
jgi:glutamate synthase (NADPH) large chain